MRNKESFDWISFVIAIGIFIISVISIIVVVSIKSYDEDNFTTIELEPGLKLEEISWKDNSLWYLTRPMRDGEQAEIHVFQESSVFNTAGRTITILETNLEDAGWE